MNKTIIIILITLFVISCKKEKRVEPESLQKNVIVKKDTLSISLEMPAKTSSGLNVWLKPYDELFLEFKNKSDKDTIIIKKIPFFNDFYQINFRAFKYDKNKNLEIINRHFIASQKKTDLELKFDSNLIKYKNKTSQSILTDSLYKSYRDLIKKHYGNKTIESDSYLKELDSLNTYFKKLIGNQILNSQINDMLYLNEIQKLKPNDKRVEQFLKGCKFIMVGGAQLSLLFNYFKNNAESLDYENLNTENHSETYLELLAIGAYRFLKFEDNKGDTKNRNVIEWLKTTEFYKRDSIYIGKQVTPLDNEKFKNYLIKIKLFDLENNELTVPKIITNTNSEYYLIDFWATWCAPCIKGVQTMNNMVIPKNVTILSFNVDKEKDKEKWKLKTKELKQNFTYWFDEKIENNKEFTKFIEMQSIPRYILIDKNMNLIDQAFYHPNESQFLSKLKDIKNHKYW